MNYVINVSKNGAHLFATSKHSITGRHTLKEVYIELELKGFNKGGYKMDVMYWENSGTEVSREDVLYFK